MSNVSPVFSTINSSIYSTGVFPGFVLLVQKIPVWLSALSPSIVKTVSSAGPISVTGFGKFSVLTGTKLKFPLLIFVKENNGFHMVKLKFPIAAPSIILFISMYP